MRLWGAIINIFGVLALGWVLIVLGQTEILDEKQFEELRLRHAMDYATEAAFRASISVEDIGIDYADISGVIVNPAPVLDVFESVLSISYDMARGAENKGKIQNAIPAGVLFATDGYYILEYVDITETEKGLHWSVKKPYVVEGKIGSKSYIYAVNLYNEDWVAVTKGAAGNVSRMVIEEGKEYVNAARNTGLTRTKVQESIIELIRKDLAYQIYARNVDLNTEMPAFYLPVGKEMQGVNNVDRPTLLLFMQGLELGGISSKVAVASVGGVRVQRKMQVVGFEENGRHYYCYEKQLPTTELGKVSKLFKSIEEAAKEGYTPHYVYMERRVEIKQ